MSDSVSAPSGQFSFNQNSKSESKHEFSDKCKPAAIRNSNILAAKAVADAIRTSLGPKGMDKMIQEGKGDVTITNDGATILKQMKLMHPAARMLVELSKAQDVEAGDGTTTVVVLAGSLLDSASKLLSKGIHPTTISEAFHLAAKKAEEIIEGMSVAVDLENRDDLLKIASTSLNSKVVSQYSSVLSPIAVDAVLKIRDDSSPHCVNLEDINIVNKLGGTVEDTELVDGLLIDRRVESLCGVTCVDFAKIGFIQFCIAPPKAEMEQSIIVSDYTQMDRVLKDERKYILDIVKKIKATGCNVLLVQKNIIRDSMNDLALHFFGKLNIMVVKGIPKEKTEFICKTLGCKPAANIEYFTLDCLSSAAKVEEISAGASRLVHITGIEKTYRTVSVLLRGSNKLVLDEAERSLHDALCVVRCLVKKRALVAGGGAPEIEVGQKMALYANSISGSSQYCFRAFAESMDVIPYTLAENAGLNPIKTVTELRHMHSIGNINAGINVKKGCVTNILEEGVIQPLLVSLNAVSLSAETVCCILKVDDVVASLV